MDGSYLDSLLGPQLRPGDRVRVVSGEHKDKTGTIAVIEPRDDGRQWAKVTRPVEVNGKTRNGSAWFPLADLDFVGGGATPSIAPTSKSAMQPESLPDLPLEASGEVAPPLDLPGFGTSAEGCPPPVEVQPPPTWRGDPLQGAIANQFEPDTSSIEGAIATLESLCATLAQTALTDCWIESWQRKTAVRYRLHRHGQKGAEYISAQDAATIGERIAAGRKLKALRAAIAILREHHDPS